MEIAQALAGVLDESGEIADDTAVAEVNDDATITDEPTAGTETPFGEEATPAPESEEPEPVRLDLTDVDRESLTPEMQGVYDRLQERQKQMQADYTRKTQAAAESVRGKTALEQEVETLRQQVAAIAQPPAPQSAAADEQSTNAPNFYEGLGEPITPEMVVGSEDPATLFAFIQQTAAVEARRAASEVAQQVTPQVQQMQQAAEQQRLYEAQQGIAEFMGANPDLEPHRQEMGALMNAGAARDLAEAGEIIRARYYAADRETEAFRLGQQTAEQRARAVGNNQRSFSVPSASTAPSGQPDLRGKSIAEVLSLLEV